LIDRIDDLSIFEIYKQAKELLGEDCLAPASVLASKILKECHQRCKLKRYAEITFQPFAGKKDPTANHVLNTFKPFYLEEYTPSKTYDVKDTLIWKYLVDVYGHGEDGLLVEYVLNMMSFLVQQPCQRSERIACLISNGEGTGTQCFFNIFYKHC
jgi:hypothetical protein